MAISTILSFISRDKPLYVEEQEIQQSKSLR
jgi:hypothetical protein